MDEGDNEIGRDDTDIVNQRERIFEMILVDIVTPRSVVTVDFQIGNERKRTTDQY